MNVGSDVRGNAPCEGCTADGGNVNAGSEFAATRVPKAGLHDATPSPQQGVGVA